MKNRSEKPKKWSRKGRCPSCDVGTGSRHAEYCVYEYGLSSHDELHFLTLNAFKNFIEASWNQMEILNNSFEEKTELTAEHFKKHLLLSIEEARHVILMKPPTK